MMKLTFKGRIDIKRMEKEFTARSRKAMTKAVTWWHRETIKVIPVRAAVGPGQFTRTARGMLKKTTQPFITTYGGQIIGGIAFNVYYARYLIEGTKYIAGGAVKRWNIGDPPVTKWPAKEEGGNPRAEMPVALSNIVEARDTLMQNLRDGG